MVIVVRQNAPGVCLKHDLLMPLPFFFQAWKPSCRSSLMTRRLPSTSSLSSGWLISMTPSAATPTPANVTG